MIFLLAPVAAQPQEVSVPRPGAAKPGSLDGAVYVKDFDARHKLCLERIAKDPATAHEEAMIWRSEGGGRRARHCEAMALFALGHAEEAAYRLDKLSQAVDGGSPQMRADYREQAADLWLKAKEPRRAYDSATAGLELDRADPDLRMARARAYAALGRWDYAEIDLSSALAFNPGNAEALRYRADARRHQGKLADAKTDIDQSLAVDGKNIDSLVVRGQINEDLRLAALAHSKAEKTGEEK